ncbi:MAG: tyrosine-type recombinase/integrase [Verrucomicrobia bacterium]|nr:tyrosine-type recombinase/integrase [Verrucomicrobiota bacterium]
MAPNHQSTRQLLEKIPNFPCLYRHRLNGTYYGAKKSAGKRKEHSLGTRDRKLAERRLNAWIADLEKVDGKARKTTLAVLLEKFAAAKQGKSAKTRATNAAITNVFKESWRHGLDLRVSEIRPSHLNEWLAQHEARLKNTTYNRYCGFLKQLFEIAVTDRLIAESPFAGVNTKWKKPQKPIRNVPTQEQFETIVANIRSQKLSADAKDTADFVEFLGLAGLGQAEAGALTWGDVDFEHRRLVIRRQKTQAVFHVPIYAHLLPLLERLRCEPETLPNPEAKVFKIKDAKKALQAACRRLNLKKFTQRNIRQALIRRLWKSGVEYKLISKWQGHQDGGKLVLDTYTEVFGDDDADYERQQLAIIK